MKNLFFFGFLLTIWAFSCPSFTVDGTQRFQVSGVIEDINGNPIEGITVGLKGFDDDFDSQVLQKVTTDKNGNYNFIHSGSNASSYILTINPQTLHDYHESIFNTEYASKSIVFSPSQYDNFYFNLDRWGQIDKAVSVNFICQSINNELNTVFLTTSKGTIIIDSIQEFANPKYTNFNCNNNKTFYFPVFDTLYINHKGKMDTLILENKNIEYKLK